MTFKCWICQDLFTVWSARFCQKCSVHARGDCLATTGRTPASFSTGNMFSHRHNGRVPLIIHILFKPKMSAQHNMFFQPVWAWLFTSTLLKLGLLLKLLLRNSKFPLKAIFVFGSQKKPFLLGVWKEISTFGGVLFPFWELNFYPFLSSPLLSAVTPTPRSKD